MLSSNFWEKIDPISFSQNGTAVGEVSITSTKKFRVGQVVYVNSNTQPQIVGKIYSFLSDTTLIIVDTENKRLDLSSYTTADNAEIEVPLQPRSALNHKDFVRASYETDPIIAFRTTLVDQQGKYLGDSENPLPTTSNESGLTKLIDDTGTILYVGTATPGSSEANTTWSIKRVQCIGPDIEIKWANATTNFVHIWDDRATYSYS